MTASRKLECGGNLSKDHDSRGTRGASGETRIPDLLATTPDGRGEVHFD